MSRSEMVDWIYSQERTSSELLSRELWEKLAKLTDSEVEEQYRMMQTTEVRR